jgi:hypothetical protein
MAYAAPATSLAFPSFVSLTDALIHEPWKASPQQNGVDPHLYPEPIMRHSATRERASAYRGLKGNWILYTARWQAHLQFGFESS